MVKSYQPLVLGVGDLGQGLSIIFPPDTGCWDSWRYCWIARIWALHHGACSRRESAIVSWLYLESDCCSCCRPQTNYEVSIRPTVQQCQAQASRFWIYREHTFVTLYLISKASHCTVNLLWASSYQLNSMFFSYFHLIKLVPFISCSRLLILTSLSAMHGVENELCLADIMSGYQLNTIHFLLQFKFHVLGAELRSESWYIGALRLPSHTSQEGEK